MLKLMSRFVLEVLPHLLSALIAAIVVPGFLSSQFHDRQPVGAANGPTAGLRSRWCATTMLPMRQEKVYRAFPPASGSASQSKSRGSNMSRHWHRVSKPLQKLAAGLHPIMTEGMSPYEIYYVLATTKKFSVSTK